MVGIIDADSVLKYDQDHLFIKLNTLPFYRQLEKVIVLVSENNPAYEQRKDVLREIWHKYGAQAYEVKKIDLDLIEQASEKKKVVFVSENRLLINAVAGKLKARFVIPHTFSNAKLAESLQRRGYTAFTIELLTRREGALARVLRLAFEDFLKLKTIVLEPIEERVLWLITERREEKELIRELIDKGVCTDFVQAKYILSKLVLQKKLYAKQEDGLIYYMPNSINP